MLRRRKGKVRKYCDAFVHFAVRRLAETPLFNINNDNPKPGTPPDMGALAQSLSHAWKLQCLLQKCARDRAPMAGKACHGQLVARLGVLHVDTIASNILINMYSKCGLVASARKVFDRMPQPCPVSWNTMIGSYTLSGNQREALALFKQMRREGTSHYRSYTFSSVLCACAAKHAVLECRQLHALALKVALDSTQYVGTALLDVYAKCDSVGEARRVFDGLSQRSAVTWSSMMAGYVQNEMYEEALLLFRWAQMTCPQIDPFRISSALCASAGLPALAEGCQLHAVLHKTGFCSNVFVTSSLVDMYSKCGCIKEAYIVFSSASAEEGNVAIWNAMISGFSKHAHAAEAVILFEKMKQMGLFPTPITYVSVLSACGHMGWVQRGWRYFDLMAKEHNLTPNVFHYSCMADVLGRAGLIHEAHDLIKAMPFDASPSMWGSLLGSCKTHGNVELATIAAEKLFEIEPDNPANHLLLSNVYAADKRWEGVASARKCLKDSKVKKPKGESWIAVEGKVHAFMAGETCHSRIEEVYLKLGDLSREMSNVADYRCRTEDDLLDVEESNEEELLRQHG